MAILSHALSSTLGLHTGHSESYPSCQSPFLCVPIGSVIMYPLLLSILLVPCFCNFAQDTQCSGDVGGDILSPSLHGGSSRVRPLCQIAGSPKQRPLFLPQTLGRSVPADQLGSN